MFPFSRRKEQTSSSKIQQFFKRLYSPHRTINLSKISPSTIGRVGKRNQAILLLDQHPSIWHNASSSNSFAFPLRSVFPPWLTAWDGGVRPWRWPWVIRGTLLITPGTINPWLPEALIPAAGTIATGQIGHCLPFACWWVLKRNWRPDGPVCCCFICVGDYFFNRD